MSTFIRKIVGGNTESYASVSTDWQLRAQIDAIEQWLTEYRAELCAPGEWIADVGFTPRRGACRGGPPLTRNLMRMCLDANIEIRPCEYSRDGNE
jgi:hypothetical protein